MPAASRVWRLFAASWRARLLIAWGGTRVSSEVVFRSKLSSRYCLSRSNAGRALTFAPPASVTSNSPVSAASTFMPAPTMSREQRQVGALEPRLAVVGALGDQLARHPEQERRVGTGPQHDHLVGLVRGRHVVGADDDRARPLETRGAQPVGVGHLRAEIGRASC